MELCQDNLVEYVQGQRGPLPNSEVAQIFLAACKAISHLHLQTPPYAHRQAASIALGASSSMQAC